MSVGSRKKGTLGGTPPPSVYTYVLYVTDFQGNYHVVRESSRWDGDDGQPLCCDGMVLNGEGPALRVGRVLERGAFPSPKTTYTT